MLYNLKDGEKSEEMEKLDPQNQVECKNISTQVDYIALIMAKNNEGDSKMSVYEDTTVANGNIDREGNFNRQISIQSNSSSNALHDGDLKKKLNIL
jgi:hypothetical protein